METVLDLTAKRAVSRETAASLEAFVDLLRKWSSALNLVSRTSLEQVWTRHVLDSLQILDLAPRSGTWVDIGSGGGFPGLVCAIAAREEAPGLRFTLVEADQRKGAFLLTTVRRLRLPVQVAMLRAEAAEPLAANVLSARALAPLPALMPLAQRHLAETGVAFFPKGRGVATELRSALAGWRFTHQKHPSLTDPEAVILEIRGVARV